MALQMIPFTVTADQLNAADVTPVSLFTFDNDGRVRVIRRLEIQRAAGTAYAPTYTGDPGRGDGGVTKLANTINVSDTYSALFSGEGYLVIEDRDSLDRNYPRLFLPIEGFLTATDEQERIVFPRVEGFVYRPWSTSIVLRSTVNLADGTGSLNGRLYIETFDIGGF